jgi:hypothetical protein
MRTFLTQPVKWPSFLHPERRVEIRILDLDIQDMGTIRWIRREIYQHPHSSICARRVQQESLGIHHKGIVQVAMLSRMAFRMTALGYLSERETYPGLE